MRRFATPLLTGLLLAFGSSAALAQSVSGTVTDERTGETLPGVSILVEGTMQGTTTDLDGNYRLQVPDPQAVLQFSYVGYTTQEVPVAGQDVLNVALAEDIEVLDDVVVVGYGTQRRGDVTASVATIDVEEANVGLVTNADDLIEGRVAGVTVTSVNGEPGAGVNIRIRGGTSISASNEPLYVIDGVPIDNGAAVPGGANVSNSAARNPLNLLNPNDIASISVLKDAAATAIYGSRGANGVVLITTRGGQLGRVVVDYEGFASSATASRTLDLLSAGEYRDFIQGLVDDGTLQPSALDNLGDASTDWQDQLFRTGISQSHNLSFAGGSPASQFRASLSFLNNEGIVESSGLERLTARLNGSNQQLDGRLRLGLNLTTGLTRDDFAPNQITSGFEGGLLQNVFEFNPTFPVFDEDAADGFYEIPSQVSLRNPFALAEQIQDAAQTTRTLGNVSAELELVDGLTAQLNVGGDRQVARRTLYLPDASPIGDNANGEAFQRNAERSSVTFQSYLSYRRALDEVNNLDFTGGYEFNEYYNEGFGLRGAGFVSDLLGAESIGAAQTLLSAGSYSFREKNRLVSFFGRGNYNFRERYYLTGSLRYDGSTRFGDNNKWALFPAVSVAWRMSEEAFLADNPTISDLRLRAGFGIVGNQEIRNRIPLELLSADPAYRAVLGGRIISGVAPFQLPNPDLRWEEKQEYTVGLDYGFFDSRLYGSVEFYRNTTENLLQEVAIPVPSPVRTQVRNVGSIRNTGLDLSLDALVLSRQNTTFSLGAVFNTNNNEIICLSNAECASGIGEEAVEIFTGTVSGRGQSGTNGQILTAGQPFPVFYGPIFEGLDADGQEIFRDVDGDGEIELSGDDRAIIGDPRPDFTYGIRSRLTVGRFGFSAFLRGEQGRDVFNNTALIYQTQSAALQGRNFLADALDDDDAPSSSAKFSSRWIEDGSFLRLDNLTLDYNLDASRLSRFARSARIYVSADNLFVITPYSGYDPEVNTNAQVGLVPALGIDWLNYPRPRVFTLGVNLGF